MQFDSMLGSNRSHRLKVYVILLALLWSSLLAGCSMGSALTSNGNGGAASNISNVTPVTISTLPEQSISADDTGAASADTLESSRPDSAERLVSQFASSTATLPPLIETQIATPLSRVQLGPQSADSAQTDASSHTVKPGDTLTRIAEHYDVTIQALLNANELTDPDLLEVGQVLKLPQPPVAYTSSLAILPDSRLVRSIGAAEFNTEEFVMSQPGVLRRMTVAMTARQVDGTPRTEQWMAGRIVERVSLEYSVDSRIMLAFLEHFANLLSDPDADADAQLYPLLESEPSEGRARLGLYNQLSWLADKLNNGYYDWKYRSKTILDTPDGNRLYYAPSVNAGTIAVQYAVAQFRIAAEWETDISEAGLSRTYRRLFGDPFADEFATVPNGLTQPELTLPFPRGQIWRYTGGFHGGWGNGSAWSAIDFAPPEEEGASAWCYVSSFPITAVAAGTITRLDDGLVVLDLDEDGDEGSGWTILYLHISRHDALRVGQVVDVGNILGYASCLGGYTTATHLHIARLYNGEWIPADCNRCSTEFSVPQFVMSHWRVVGLGSQLYQGFLVHELDNRSAVAEQSRFTDVNIISW